MAGQDAIIGFVGGDFAMIATDMNAGRSIMVLNHEADKIMQLDSHKLLGVGGDPADCVQEPQYFQKNISLSYYKHGNPLSTHAVANYMRGEKSANLRKGMAQVDMLLVGYDEGVGPSLYFLDYLASMQKLDKGAHGYCGFFVNSLLDAHWKPGMTVDEGLQLMALCAAEMKRRFAIVSAPPAPPPPRVRAPPPPHPSRRLSKRAAGACVAGHAEMDGENCRQRRHPGAPNARLLGAAPCRWLTGGRVLEPCAGR